MKTEKTAARGSPRLELALPARLVPDPSEGEGVLEVTTRDLGGGGLLCEGPVAPPQGARFTLQITLPGEGGGTRLSLPVLVVRVDGAGPYILALRYADPTDRALESIRRFVHHRLVKRGG